MQDNTKRNHMKNWKIRNNAKRLSTCDVNLHLEGDGASFIRSGAHVNTAFCGFGILDAHHSHVALEGNVIDVRGEDLSVIFVPAYGQRLWSGHSALKLHRLAFVILNVLWGFLSEGWWNFAFCEGNASHTHDNHSRCMQDTQCISQMVCFSTSFSISMARPASASTVFRTARRAVLYSWTNNLPVLLLCDASNLTSQSNF